MIYEEPKKLVTAGLVTSQVTFTGKRRSTVYQITDAGRAALRDWLDTPAAGMRMEFEAMIKVAFADAGDVTQLRAAVREIRADAEARLAEILDRSTQYATTGGPFPDRLPIVAITGKLLMSQYEAVVRWARWAEDAMGEWTGVTPATGATVPPYAFTSGWPVQYAEHAANMATRLAEPSPRSTARVPTGIRRSAADIAAELGNEGHQL
jgi:DNA-binding PadR family transcriptional regulator